MRKMLIPGAVAAAVLVAAAVTGIYYLGHRPLNTPAQVAGAYLQRWEAQDWAAMRVLVTQPPADFTAVHADMVKSLSVSAFHLGAGAVTLAGTSAQAPITVGVDLEGLSRPWTYTSTLHLARIGRHWRVVWSPATLQPQLGSGNALARKTTWADRASIQARDGTVLEGKGNVAVVGIELDKIASVTATVAAFQQFAAVDPATTTRVLHTPGAKPSWFLPVVQLREAQFQTLPPAFVKADPGILVQHTTGNVTISDGFASTLLGSVGPITADRLRQLGPPYTATSVVGLSGLELSEERQLAGTPTVDIDLVDSNGSVLQTLDHYDGVAPQPVQTTIDPAIQTAGENAFSGVTTTAALVALDAATGEIRAVVDRPANGFDRALAGGYPPGSTMKIVTTDALLLKGDDLTTPISCPTDTVVDGKHFHNIEGEGGTQLTLQQAFVQSCNTAFVQLAATLKPNQLTQAAKNLGFDAKEPLPLNSAGGSFPAPKDLVDQAGAAIGQAEVLASPLHMASVAAAVDSGAWHQPTLIAGASATATVNPLDPGVAAKLRTLMRLVVSDPMGTGVAARLPGTPVSGKTGTAEFGPGNPPKTHAWFVGFRGGLAFAVLVEGGGVGGKVAAPLAAKFLSLLPG